MRFRNRTSRPTRPKVSASPARLRRQSEDLDEEVRERLLGCVQEVVSRRPWGTSPCWCAPTEGAQVAGWLMEEGSRRHRQQLPARRASSAEQITALLTFLDSRATIWHSDIPFRPPDAVAAYPLSEQALEDWAAARRTSERRNMPLFMAFREDFPTSGGSGSRLSMPTRAAHAL
ncbi:MAG: hypothetical protein ACLSAH_07245 [Bilophila wadsworthia]